MITVIGETNFAFDILFERDYASAHILEMAKNNEIVLVLPSFSMAEVRGQIIEVIDNREKKLESFRSFLKDLSRSEYYTDRAKTCLSNVKYFLRLNREEHGKAQNIIEILLKHCRTINYSPIIATNAELRFREKKPPFKENDCKIYESVLQFLSKEKEKALFLTKDKSDFDHEEIHQKLKELDCELYFNSGKVVRRVKELVS